MGNFIKIDRKMLKWEWYKNEHTKNVFLHCLLKAYWKDTKIEGKTIPRGSFVSSIGSIAEELALTPMEVRTALKHLKLTNEVTSKGTNRNTVFTVTNYDLYQSKEQAEQQTDNKQIANEQQTDNEQITSKEQTINKPLTTNEEYKEDKNIKNDEEGEEKELYTDCYVFSVSDLSDTTKTSQSVRQTEVRRAVEAWNRLTGYGILPVSKMSSTSNRYKMLSARIGQYGIDDVLKAIEKIKQSDFLQGKKNDFLIKFDWFVRPNNFPKVLEGNYDDKPDSQNTEGESGHGLYEEEFPGYVQL